MATTSSVVIQKSVVVSGLDHGDDDDDDDDDNDNGTADVSIIELMVYIDHTILDSFFSLAGAGNASTGSNACSAGTKGRNCHHNTGEGHST